ncbi:MAG: hypothetical protein KatS3mg005_2618 [Bryobacteraceae bacterium]|nr:MAG: hypothetical protein KatS3mg005_2618 [Bryobacteraceae bacterium]
MIVSASYRTDIPAFYPQWFLRRLQEGFALVRNPYSAQMYRVDLRPQHVTGFVFWTRNFGPLLDQLDRLRAFGRPFAVQFTITNYPRAIEPAVIPAEKAVAQMHRLAREVHPLCPVWRYDPVLLTSLTPPDFHLGNFDRLAAQLEGSTDEAVISFAQIYAKSRRNLDAAARRHGFAWEDPADEAKRALAAELAGIARRHGMRLTVCSQPDYVVEGAGEARCVDVRRLARISGEPLDAPLKGNRPGCACHESRDIGEYDTCPHGCLYCYAVRHRRVALARYRTHDPAAPSLLPVEKEPVRPLPLLER